MGKAKGCLVVLLGLAIVGGVRLAFVPSTPDTRTPEEKAASERAANVESAWRTERSGRIAYAKTLLQNRAKDPDAVQFRNVEAYRNGGDVIVCGELNAKNSFGAYTGFKTFVHAGDLVVTAEDAQTLGVDRFNALVDRCKEVLPTSDSAP